jgi:predicted Zn finger-like uncharacterized protein
MIIQCKNCQTKFNLDESLIKEQGSRVRCSFCRHIFVAYPPNRAYAAEGETIIFHKEEMEETLAQDLPDTLQEEEIDAEEEEQPVQFDNAFAESLEDVDSKEAESPEDFVDLAQGKAGVNEKPVKPTHVKKGATLGKLRKPHLLPIILVIILILIAAAAAIFIWLPGLIPDSLPMLKPANKQEIADMGVRRLSFKSVTGSFVDSENSGSLFVIRGMVTNDYPKSRSFILIKGTILDDKGQVVKRKLAYVGNNFKEEEIKSLPLEKINKAMKNRYGMGRKNVNITPGASIQFTIVFEDLPKNLSEFTVEAVSSSPGTK